MTPGVFFVGQLLSFRRRLVWVAFVRHASVAGAAAIVTAALAGRLVWGDAAWGWMAVAAIAGVLGAALLAVLRAPTVSATGAAIDRRLDLADRVTAAVEFADGADPVAQLVVDSASRRLAIEHPPQLFPLRAHPRAGVAWAAAAGIVALVALFAPDSRDGTDAAARTASGAGSGPAPAGTPADTTRQDGSGQSPDGARVLSAGDTPREPGGAATADPSRQPDAQAAPRSLEAADAGSAAQQGAAAPPGSGQGIDERTDARAQEAARGNGSNGADGASGSGRLGAAGPGRDATASRGGAAAGPAATTRNRDAGGVQGGTSGASRAVAAPSATETAADVARARDVRRRAEAALLRDEVPPHLRPYVREYFAAIQSTER
jgi:hypothetical protein